MVGRKLFIAGAAAAVLLAPLLPAQAQPGSPEPGGVHRERVIVQLDAAAALAGSSGLTSPKAATRTAARTTVDQRAGALRHQHGDFLRGLADAGVDVDERADLTDVLNAVALTVKSTDLPRLRATPGVRAVYPDNAVHAASDPDVSITNAPQVWSTDDPSGRPDTGTGETVAVIDTGIDYNHPDLGSGFGPGHKVVGGYDFVNNDADPMDDNGHGTHVAGLVAGKAATPNGRTGEAPGATLTAYKVLDANGNGWESQIIEGLEAAVATDNPYRADVVNLSLGGASELNDPLDQACEDAITSGVVVVAAAGNYGPGESTVGSPAEAPHVLAVGASVSGVDVPSITVTAPVRHAIHASRLNFSADPPADGESLDVLDLGSGRPSDFDAADVTGKAVLISYNSQQLAAVLALAAQHHVAAVLFSTANYYTQSGSQPGPVLPDFAAGTADPNRLGFVATAISGTDGVDIQQWLAQGAVRIQVGTADATDEMAAFSAHGPAPVSYAIKPDLVAPGVEIPSTWPGGGYQDDSGTSMAAPHVAGAAALVLQAHPNWTAGQVAAALTGGAHDLPGFGAETVGAGRLDVAAADRLAVLASPRSVNLGLADLSGARIHASGAVNFQNVSPRAVTLHFAARRDPAAALQVFYSPTSARVAPGASVRVSVGVTGPTPTADADETGLLTARGAGQTVAVPYSLAVRPLDLHASPDPTSGYSTVYIRSEPDLADAPQVVVTSPHGRVTSSAAIFDHPGWWRLPIPAGPAGTYRITASAPSRLGAVLTGTVYFEKLAAPKGTSRWQAVGPDNQGAAVLAPTSRAGRMYLLPASSPHAGIFRTDDGGASWTELRRLPVADGFNSGLAADPEDPDTVYLALQGGSVDPTYEGKLLVSHDAGATWETLPFPNVSMRSVSVDASGSVLTVPAFDGNVYVSTDRGQTWTAYPSPADTPNQAAVIGDDLFIAAARTLYVVRNVDVDPSAPQLIFTAPGETEAMEGIVSDGQVLFARSSTGLYSSGDAGATWQKAFTPPSDDPFPDSLQVVDGAVYLTGKKHIWVTRDEGSTWQSLATPARQDQFKVSSWDPSGHQLVISGAAYGIFTTSDRGASYQRVGLAATPVSSLVVDETAAGLPGLLAGTTNTAFSTPLPERQTVTDQTRDWGITSNEANIGFRVKSLAVDPAHPKTVFAATVNAFSRIDIERSADGGASWSGVLESHSGSVPYQIIVDPADPNYVYAAVVDGLAPGVLVSRDGGVTWRKNDLPMQVTTVAADPTDPNRIWLGGPGGLYESTDGGQTVTTRSTIPVTAIAVDPHDRRHLLVGGNGIWETHDAAHTLNETVQSPFRLHISAIVIAPDGSTYAGDSAGTDSSGLPLGGRGVLARAAGGSAWANVSDGLPDLDVTSLAVAPDGNWLYAGTLGGGVYRLAR